MDCTLRSARADHPALPIIILGHEGDVVLAAEAISFGRASCPKPRLRPGPDVCQRPAGRPSAQGSRQHAPLATPADLITREDGAGGGMGRGRGLRRMRVHLRNRWISAHRLTSTCRPSASTCTGCSAGRSPPPTRIMVVRVRARYRFDRHAPLAQNRRLPAAALMPAGGPALPASRVPLPISLACRPSSGP